MLLASRLPLLPGNLRARLFQLAGVKFKNVKTNFIGYNVYFDDLNPQLIEIGENTIITEGARVLTHFLDVSYDDFDHQYLGAVVIGKNVFIGMNTIIVKPLTISDGAIIGANSVVNKDIIPYTIWAGNPINLIKKTGNEVLNIPEGHICCGSAGTYNILQQKIAKTLLMNKVKNIEKILPDFISTGNIGCMTQIASGTNIPIVHTVEVIDWLTGGPKPYKLKSI